MPLYDLFSQILDNMQGNGSPRHPGSSGGGGGGDADDFGDEMIYEEVPADFDDDDDLIEVIDDDDDPDNTDMGNLADDEEDGDFDYSGPGMEGFEGVKPDHILSSHLGEEFLPLIICWIIYDCRHLLLLTLAHV